MLRSVSRSSLSVPQPNSKDKIRSYNARRTRTASLFYCCVSRHLYLVFLGSSWPAGAVLSLRDLLLNSIDHLPITAFPTPRKVRLFPFLVLATCSRNLSERRAYSRNVLLLYNLLDKGHLLVKQFMQFSLFIIFVFFLSTVSFLSLYCIIVILKFINICITKDIVSFLPILFPDLTRLSPIRLYIQFLFSILYM
jgi:hypothetical protein